MTGVHGPYVIVHTITHVREAVSTAQTLGRPVTLISAPGAAASTGAEVFMHMIEAGLAEAKKTGYRAVITAVIDCGSDPGQALQAIRLGCTNIRLDAGTDVITKFRDMVGPDGLVLDGTPLNVYDMDDNDRDQAPGLEDWLQTEQ